MRSNSTKLKVNKIMMMMVMTGHTILIRSKMRKLLMLIRCTVTSLLKFWTNSKLNLNKTNSALALTSV